MLMQAGGLISAMEATRRVLILENPGLRGTGADHRLAVRRAAADPAGRDRAGAPPHAVGAAFYHRGQRRLYRGRWRAHGDAARRFRHHAVLDLARSRPRGHGHEARRNEGGEPMVWLDGLDIQIVKLLSASFAEPGAADMQQVTRPEGDSLARYGNNLLPVDWKPEVKTSPVFNYPYARTREALDALVPQRRSRPVSRAQAALCQPGERRARRCRRSAPSSNSCRAASRACPTARPTARSMSASREAARRASPRSAWRGRAATGAALGAARHLCRAGLDAAIRIMPATKSVLFSFSDRPVQEKLGLWREARGNA